MVCSGLFCSELNTLIFYCGASNGVSFYKERGGEPTFLKRLDQMFWPSVCKFFNNGVSFDPSLSSSLRSLMFDVIESYEDIELENAGPGDS